MPTDSSGNFTLPAIYLATTGETVIANQHNAPLEDIESALTGRLPRNGTAGMTSPLKLSDGTAAAPALTFSSAPSWGLYKTATGIGLSIGGVFVVELGGTPTGAILEFAGATAPAGYLLCYGQAISRSTYSQLFDVIGTEHGAGDGSTTFNVPDRRGRVGAGVDNMGGSDASRLASSASTAAARNTLGGVGGASSITLTTSTMPTHSHGVTDPGHTHDLNEQFQNASSGANNFNSVGGGTSATTPVNSNTTGISIQNAGSGAAHDNVQPTILNNYIIKT